MANFQIFIILSLSFAIINLCHSQYIWTYNYVPSPPIYTRPVTSLEYMIDNTNDFCYKYLNYHSRSNRNNFAFSPTALSSVMIAVYEGSVPTCSNEIREAMSLPWNLDITRIGFRDIQRRLRVYFFNKENPLSCLSLNKENVTVTPEYESVLEFYGYDLGPQMIGSRIDIPETTIKVETTTVLATTEVPTTLKETTTPEATTIKTTEMPTTTPEPTTTPTTAAPTTTEAATTAAPTDLPTTTPTTAASTTTPTTAAPTTTPTTAAPTTPPTTAAPTTTPTTAAPTTEKETTPATTTEATTPPVTTPTTEAVTTPSPTTEPATTPPATTEPATTPTPTTEPATTPTPTTVPTTPTPTTEPPTTPPTTEAETTPQTTEAATTPAEDTTPAETTPATTEEATTTDAATTESPPDSSLIRIAKLVKTSKKKLVLEKPEKANRIKRQIFEDVFGQPSYPYTILNRNPVILQVPRTQQVFFRPRSLPVQNEIQHLFYLNPKETIQTKYKVFNAPMKHAYLSSLRATALDLDLDSKNYNMMMMIPDNPFEVENLVQSLNAAPSLRKVRSAMTTKMVQAIVPDFKMNGRVVLTNALQDMGIGKIFEPNKECLRPMTNEKNIYVKHIEQVINLSIKTKPVNQLRRNLGPYAQPVELSVNHPFLFFIMDKELDLAILAGRVMNPMNVRITK